MKNWNRNYLLKNFILIFLIIVIGFSCNREKKSIESKKNNPPLITLVNIVPEKPDVESELSVVIRSEDPDGDPITYQYQWIKNDKEMIGENRSILNRGKFKKGDTIKIKIIPSDGKLTGKPFISNPVIIMNSPPVIEKIWIEPKIAYVKDDLKVKVKSNDKDGDFIYYTYRWEKNGEELPDENGDTLRKGIFKKGDSIAVIVIPDDRESQGNPKKSDPIIISNSPPLIISSPPNSAHGMEYIYQVKVDDPDNDPISFKLKSYPKGMEIDKDNGLIKWALNKDMKGSYLIEIEAYDNEGAKCLQKYTLKIEFK